MVISGRTIHTSHHKFSLFSRLGDYLAATYLARRGRAHIAEGLPPMAAFSFDYIAREITLRGRFEREELATLANFLAPLAERFSGTTALDVGANIGNHSLFFSTFFKTVHSFEPNPQTFSLLEVNSRLADNIVPHNVGLGERSGTMTLAFNPLNIGEASLLRPPTNKSSKTTVVSVNIDSLDNVSPSLGQISFIKIDVEGFEPEVLRGAEATLMKHKPIIAFEQNPDAFSNGRSETVELLQAAGYTFCVMAKRNATHGFFRRIAASLIKLARGIEYDVYSVSDIPRGHYPMVIALPPSDLAILTRPFQ